MNPTSSEPAEEREDDISSLAARFARMHKRATSFERETTPSFEVLDGKRPKWSSPNREAQNSLAIITVDSPKRASDALSALESAA